MSIYGKFLFCLALLWSSVAVAQNPLQQRLAGLDGVESVEQIAGGKFKEKYVVQFRQLRNPVGAPADTSTFLQRVIVGHISLDSAVVLHTHGYSAADHTQRIQVRDELSELLGTNNIFVEHRYFGTSCPADTNWNEVTTANAAYDMHRIVTALKTVYSGRWISTGGSKDGITSALYSMYYPHDVDLSVPYVAPFCLTQQDPRGYQFLRQVGKPAKRARILNWQREAFRRRNVLEPMVRYYADSLNMRFIVPFEMVYDYCILDYDFGIWMRGISEDEIPLPYASDKQMYDHFIKYANPDMFDRNKMPHQTYYVQSAKELGNYAYDLSLFAEYLSAATLAHDGYLKDLYLPEGDWDFSYSDAAYQRLFRFLDTTDCRLVFIYGETDAWTAFPFPPTDNPNIRIYTLPGGCHYSKIREFPEDTRRTIMDNIHNWLQ
ncbi:MAG: aminopeptidase [Paludibacteraceae bacterium]|nr:aminopeptidase [Paludibacteraceae bacterium]